MKRNILSAVILYAVEIILFTLVVAGVLPRDFSFLLASVLLLYCGLATLENAVVFFIASIPLCVALPISPTFDSLNMWRLASLLIFLRWLFQREIIFAIGAEIKNLGHEPHVVIRRHPFITGALLLISIALLGIFLTNAAHGLILRRIIYFVNLSFIGVIVYDLTRQGKLVLRDIVIGLLSALIVITLAGYIQLISTFFIDIYQFVDVWGRGVQLRQFGEQWSYIAVNTGNTWFAYYGEQLSLRMFSLFPDSHSFPIALLLCLPALMAYILHKLPLASERFRVLARMQLTWWVLFLPFVLLGMILSSTRGIWAAGIALIIVAPVVTIILGRIKIVRLQRNINGYLVATLGMFALLIFVAYPIFSAPQFLLSKDDSLLLGKRFRSILDINETSNAQRIAIWRASVKSIIKHPFLGVGLYNFPKVLDQKLELSKAGSSAHNLYLHIAAELGLPALLISLWLLWLLLRRCFTLFRHTSDPFIAVFTGTALLSLMWVLLYSMTDIAIFDERAFLIFMVLGGAILGTAVKIDSVKEIM